jgi:hypothetical protein
MMIQGRLGLWGLVPCEASPPAPLHCVERGGPALGVAVGRTACAVDVAGAHSAPYGLLRFGGVIPLHLWRGTEGEASQGRPPQKIRPPLEPTP